MKKDVLREMARRGYPVVALETGSVGEIVYSQIREIKVIYATPEEKAAGVPVERMAVVAADRSGRSFTELLARQLRLPTAKEACDAAPDEMTAADMDEMIEALAELAEKEAGY